VLKAREALILLSVSP